MKRTKLFFLASISLILAALPVCGVAQHRGRAVTTAAAQSDAEFGPVVRAYLGYLRSELEVVDDRASRREISPAYYRRNVNRIRALRQIAVRTARESNNDYLPEFEAVTRDEFGSLFETPPRPEMFRTGEVLNNTFRFLGVIRMVDVFYVFARLDPYEQAELMQKSAPAPAASPLPAASAHPALAPVVNSKAPTTAQPGTPSTAARPRRSGTTPP
ncbi:MAG: hypothetical protein ACR2LC_01665 [Pyrinomonadaceae bacterium]